MPCSYVDRRGRRCKTAWCPADRNVVEGQIYCALHAHAMQALEWEFGAASHPDIDSRTVPILQWISSAAADEVIATLNVYCALHGEMLVAEPVRRKFNPVAHSRVWEKQWKTLSPTNVSLRVCISSDEARPTEIHIQVNGHDVNVVPPPWNRELSEPDRGGSAVARPGGARADRRGGGPLDDAGRGGRGPRLHADRRRHRRRGRRSWSRVPRTRVRRQSPRRSEARSTRPPLTRCAARTSSMGSRRSRQSANARPRPGSSTARRTCACTGYSRRRDERILTATPHSTSFATFCRRSRSGPQLRTRSRSRPRSSRRRRSEAPGYRSWTARDLHRT